MATGATYLDRKLSGIAANVCTYPGCKREPADDSMMCVAHRDGERKRKREHRRKRRAEWRAAKRCLSCGGERVPRRRYCAACLVARNRTPHQRVDNGVDKRDRIAQNTRTLPDGRTRYIGPGRRGTRPAVAEDELDLLEAKKRIERALLGLQYAKSAEVQALPRIQRKGVEHEALSQADHGARFIESVLERHRYGGRIARSDD